MPRLCVYFVRPSRIARIAASRITAGVSKSGSPNSRWTTSWPWRSSSSARSKTSTARNGLISSVRLARSAKPRVIVLPPWPRRSSGRPEQGPGDRLADLRIARAECGDCGVVLVGDDHVDPLPERGAEPEGADVDGRLPADIEDDPEASERGVRGALTVVDDVDARDPVAPGRQSDREVAPRGGDAQVLAERPVLANDLDEGGPRLEPREVDPAEN